MPNSPLATDFAHVSSLDLWVLWLKVMATGVSFVLFVLVAIFAWSRRGHRDRDTAAALLFTLANLFATLYIAADTAVRVDVFLGNAGRTLIWYKLALSAAYLSLAAYIGLYWSLDRTHPRPRWLMWLLCAAAALPAVVVWVEQPYLVIASNRLTIRGLSVFADYGAAAPWFFALGIVLFAAFCVGMLRMARWRTEEALASKLNLLGLALLLAAGAHDALREMGVYLLPFGTLSLGYAGFQVGAFAFVALHYSRTLRERRRQGLEIERLSEKLWRDPLTGQHTRAYLEDLLDRRGAGAAGGGLLFIDLDDFKLINDRYGHLVGDAVLREVGHRLAGSVRAGDVVCRWGGDEFVVYLARADADEVQNLAHRLETELRHIRVAQASGLLVRVSLGFAAIAASDWRTSLRLADGALYDSKRAGKNRLTLVWDADEDNPLRVG